MPQIQLVHGDGFRAAGLDEPGGFPALDGGRIFLLLVNSLFTAITKKKIPAKYEAYVHAAGMVLLLGFMAFVTFKDIWKIFT